MASQYLMSEDDIIQYFLQNNGIVRNTEIVTYFRFYLSDPNIRDEARMLFKSYVNKLANVKTENGEKFLVLKRQYFPPIDGRPSSNQLSNYPPSQSHYNNNNPYGYPPSRPIPSPYDSAYPPPPVQSQHPLQRSLSQSQSQSHLYGSAFSLNSNYLDPYPTYSHPPPLNSNQYGVSTSTPHMNYGIVPPQSEYGLPPPNSISSPNKRFSSSPSNNNSMVSLNSSSSIPSGRLPPPYRPPPPAARFNTVSVQPTTSPFAAQQSMTGPILRHPTNFPPGRYPSPLHTQSNFSSEPTTPTGPQIQFQRSLSVSGSLTSPPPSQLQYEGGGNYFEPQQQQTNSAFGAPPPPVPPRSKRSSFERSLTRSGSLASSSTTMDDYDNGRNDSNGFMKERSNSMGSSGNGTNLVGRVRGYSEGREGGGNLYELQEKENLHLQMIGNGVPYGLDVGDDDEGNGDGIVSVNSNGGINGNNSEMEQKISVKERLQKFNRIASEHELTAGTKMPSASRNRRDVASKHDSVDYDTASLSSFGFGFASMQPRDKEWILKAAQSDYHYLNKMAQENPSLVKRKDINYTALHWAAKHGNVDLVKLLAGTFKSNVNAKSNGGYSPLHLAAQFGRQEVYDILKNVYNADVNVRDHSGKKPMQYYIQGPQKLGQDSNVSMDAFTFKKLKEKRRSAEHRERDRDSSFLRIGSLNVRVKMTNVRVKKTTEAFNNFLLKSNSSNSIERILHKTWGSADNIIPESDNNLEKDKHIMPPPSNASIPRSSKAGKRKTRTSNQMGDATIKETRSDSDSDTAAGFGSDWPR